MYSYPKKKIYFWNLFKNRLPKSKITYLKYITYSQYIDFFLFRLKVLLRRYPKCHKRQYWIMKTGTRFIQTWVWVLAVTLEDLINLQFYHMKMKIIISILAGAYEDLMKIIITPIIGLRHRQCSIAIKSTQSLEPDNLGSHPSLAIYKL